jgi:hypothetical protein
MTVMVQQQDKRNAREQYLWHIRSSHLQTTCRSQSAYRKLAAGSLRQHRLSVQVPICGMKGRRTWQQATCSLVANSRAVSKPWSTNFDCPGIATATCHTISSAWPSGWGSWGGAAPSVSKGDVSPLPVICIRCRSIWSRRASPDQSSLTFLVALTRTGCWETALDASGKLTCRRSRDSPLS